MNNATKQPCLKCRVVLGSQWLKAGVCNACRNPESVVVAVVEKKLKQPTKLNANIELKEPRKCNFCGKLHTTVPNGARWNDDEDFAGFYFECDCKETGTMFVKASSLKGVIFE